MNKQLIAEKLNKLQKNDKNQGSSRAGFFWSPEIGKHDVRIVPRKDSPDDPFLELFFHKKISKYSVISLSNFGESDPVELFIKELKKVEKGEEYDPNKWRLAGSLTPAPRYFVPVIVRGEEEKGVRMWGFGKTVYESLLQMASDEEIGDFTDIENGWDMVVTAAQGPKYKETSVRLKMKQSPLSTDAKQVKKWLVEQPSIDDMFAKPDFDFIKEKLKEYVDSITDKQEEAEEPKTQRPVTLGTQKGGVSANKNFNNLFDEEED